ncbi:MAG TPA: hypothetical protein HPQ04_13580 [Rhodospirillaceae bacterium]|nr:hypothetical protein [Rhodospirillaceae bacterium]
MTVLKTVRRWWQDQLSLEALDCGWPLRAVAGARHPGLFDGQWEITAKAFFPDQPPPAQRRPDSASP